MEPAYNLSFIREFRMRGTYNMLKSQDIVVALKLSSFQLHELRQKRGHDPAPAALLSAWAGWEADSMELALDESHQYASLHAGHIGWTYATLSKLLGISASECNEAVKRGLTCGLLRISRTGRNQPVPYAKAILEFIVHGLKYVFPAEEGPLSRGIPTGFAAPILATKLLTAGTHVHVWPDARGSKTGITLRPIHKAVTVAVRYDPIFYELIALVDAIRFGMLREATMATEILTQELSTI